VEGALRHALRHDEKGTPPAHPTHRGVPPATNRVAEPRLTRRIRDRIVRVEDGPHLAQHPPRHGAGHHEDEVAHPAGREADRLGAVVPLGVLRGVVFHILGVRSDPGRCHGEVLRARKVLQHDHVDAAQDDVRVDCSPRCCVLLLLALFHHLEAARPPEVLVLHRRRREGVRGDDRHREEAVICSVRRRYRFVEDEVRVDLRPDSGGHVRPVVLGEEGVAQRPGLAHEALRYPWRCCVGRGAFAFASGPPCRGIDGVERRRIEEKAIDNENSSDRCNEGEFPAPDHDHDADAGCGW